jgi:hypothetical protein
VSDRGGLGAEDGGGGGAASAPLQPPGGEGVGAQRGEGGGLAPGAEDADTAATGDVGGPAGEVVAKGDVEGAQEEAVFGYGVL